MCNDKPERHNHHGHFEKNPDSLYGMMRRCGHIMHHTNPDPQTAFNGLSEEEQEQLKGLLTKLLASWKPQKEEAANSETAE